MSGFNDFNQNCIHAASLVIIYYDHFITFADEFNYIWKCSKSVSSITFLINRYFSFITNFPLLMSFIWMLAKLDVFPKEAENDNMMSYIEFYRTAVLIISGLIIEMLALLRVYALCGRPRFIARYITPLWVILYLFTGACALYSLTNPKGVAASPAFESMAWEFVAIWDGIMFAIIAAKIGYAHKTKGVYVFGANRAPILTLMWRDGALYFIALSIVNIANIATYYTAGKNVFFRGSLATLSNAISVTMMSRLMLNLHTTSIEASRRNPISDLSSTHIDLLPNAAFLGSNANDDIWDSKFTLTDISHVQSYDVFASSLGFTEASESHYSTRCSDSV